MNQYRFRLGSFGVGSTLAYISFLFFFCSHIVFMMYSRGEDHCCISLLCALIPPEFVCLVCFV